MSPESEEDVFVHGHGPGGASASAPGLAADAAAALVDFAQGAPPGTGTAAAKPGSHCQWLLLKDPNYVRAGAEAYLAAQCVASASASSTATTSAMELWQVASCSIDATGRADVTFHVRLQVPDCSAAGLSPTRPSNIARVGSQLWLRLRWATVASAASDSTVRITFGVYDDRPSRVHPDWLAGLRGLDPDTTAGSQSWPPSQQISRHETFLPVGNTGTATGCMTPSASASAPSLPRKLPLDNTVTVSFALLHMTLLYLLRQLVDNATHCTGLVASNRKYEGYFESTRNDNGLQYPRTLLPAEFIDKRKTVVVAAVEPCLWLVAGTGSAVDRITWASSIRTSECHVLVPT